METDISNQKVNKYKSPTVMTALAVDNQVFLASSMKGGQYVYEKHDADGTVTLNIANMPSGEQLQKALEKCMKPDGDVTPDNQHKNNAMCGEIMAAWLLNHHGQDLKNKSPQPVVVAWNGKSKSIMDPCSTEKPNKSEWGCHEFVGIKGLNFKVVDKSTQQEDYDCIVKGTAQQQLPNLTRQKSEGGKAKREEEEEEEEEEKPNSYIGI